MQYRDMQDVVRKLKRRLETDKGLAIFARQRSKFEGWLKAELCRIIAERKDVKTSHYVSLRKDLVIPHHFHKQCLFY